MSEVTVVYEFIYWKAGALLKKLTQNHDSFNFHKVIKKSDHLLLKTIKLSFAITRFMQVPEECSNRNNPNEVRLC